MVRLAFARGSSRAHPISRSTASRMARRNRKARRWARPHKYSGGFAQKVKKVLLRNAETKYVRDDIIGTATLFNSVVSTYSDFYRAFPSLAQGVQSNNRLDHRVCEEESYADGWSQHMSQCQSNSAAPLLNWFSSPTRTQIGTLF